MSNTFLKIIQNAIKNNKLSHAYLFYGDKGVDVESPIFKTIKLLLEKKGKHLKGNNIEELIYYDLKIVKPNQDGLIKKDVIDEAINSLSSSSLERDLIKFLYIKDVDKGNKSSLNRMLKFIEEPSKNLIIFMSTNKFGQVISTIKSRTQNIFIKQEPKNEIIKKINAKHGSNLDITNLLISIYPNYKQINEINLVEFKNTYKLLMSILERGLNNFEILKIELSKLWTKKNSENILNIMQYFFYQLQIDIDTKYPLFPGYEALINKYKIKKMPLCEVIKEIDLVKQNIKSYSNFTLQKNYLLNVLEVIYGN